MPKWIGNRYGNCVPIAPNTEAPSGIYNIIDQYYSRQEDGWTIPPDGIEATGGTIHNYEECLEYATMIKKYMAEFSNLYMY